MNDKASTVPIISSHPPLPPSPDLTTNTTRIGALAKARQQAVDGVLPRCAYDYDADPVRLLVGVCAALGAKGDTFYLSCHDAGNRLKLHPPQVHRYLAMLSTDKIIELVKTGNQRRANRYRWIWISKT